VRRGLLTLCLAWLRCLPGEESSFVFAFNEVELYFLLMILMHNFILFFMSDHYVYQIQTPVFESMDLSAKVPASLAIIISPKEALDLMNLPFRFSGIDQIVMITS
jgi:hypothetical protein